MCEIRLLSMGTQMARFPKRIYIDAWMYVYMYMCVHIYEIYDHACMICMYDLYVCAVCMYVRMYVCTYVLHIRICI